MNRKRILQGLGVVGASAVLALGTATASFAGSDGPKVCNSSPQSACAKFYNNGDVIRVWDTDCDGHAAVGHVYAPTIGLYDNLWNTDGCGTYRDYAYGTSMPENVQVYYQACYGVWSTKTITRCSDVRSGRS